MLLRGGLGEHSIDSWAFRVDRLKTPGGIRHYAHTRTLCGKAA